MYKRKLAGIYIIEHTSGHFYIGKSVSIYDRWSSHYTQLKQGIHHSKDFQDLWIKSDITEWSFRILYQLSKTYVKGYSKLKGKELDKLFNKLLLTKEKEYMKMYSINFCLNGHKNNFS